MPGSFCFRLPRPWAFLPAALLLLASQGLAAPDASLGEGLFLQHCALCHQPTGQGAPPVYPPLAGSDWLIGNRVEAIRTVCEGRSGPLKVKGQMYDNVMPAQMLDDAQVAAVLSYVLTAWGNRGQPVTVAEVTAARATTKFATYAALEKASSYAPLPEAPAGWTVREVARLPEFCTRLAGDGQRVFVLAQKGTVYLLDIGQGAVTPVIRGADYLRPEGGDFTTMGMTLGPDGRLWLVSNQRVASGKPVQNEVVIYHAAMAEGGLPGVPQPWLKLQYPYGIGSFNHGVSQMGFGPDGFLYVNSGSRTDGGEPGHSPDYFAGGEVDLTACLWRLDPKAALPKAEVFARGIRNAYGFAWDSEGHLFTASNGPDASAPEELDQVAAGRHYGFPYQFSNWPAKAGSPYPHTPAAPAGLQFTLPVTNLGPAGGGSPAGLATFEPHSSPAGMMWCGDEFPEPLHHAFLLTRFGNLLGPPAAPVDVGFDALALKMQAQPDGSWTTRATRVLSPLGRPVDVIHGPGRTVLLLEYTRPLNFKDQLAWLPGRILELAPAK